MREFVAVNWQLVPAGGAEARLMLKQVGGASYSVTVRALKRQASGARGFIEGDGFVSMEAAHFSGKTDADGVSWQEIPGFGETLSGMEAYPVTAASTLPPEKSACIEYRMKLFDTAPMELTMTLAPTLNFVPGRGLRLAVGMDRQPLQVVDVLAHNNEQDWAKAVSDGVRRVEIPMQVEAPGEHTLRVCRVDPGVVVERLLLSKGSVPRTYLGPPESVRVPE
jgi:hypothetical protein